MNFMICELYLNEEKLVPEGKVGKIAKFCWKFRGGHSFQLSSALEHFLLTFSKFQSHLQVKT